MGFWLFFGLVWFFVLAWVFCCFKREMARERGNLSKLFECCLENGPLCPLSAVLAGILMCSHKSSTDWQLCLQPHHFGCELCTARHWKGAFDHCCKISDLNFIMYCAIAELCMCVTPYNDKSLRNKHPCMSSAMWTVFCNSHGCTVVFLITCSVTASHSYFPASDVLSFLCPLVISPAVMERSELALQRLAINDVSHWRGG